MMKANLTKSGLRALLHAQTKPGSENTLATGTFFSSNEVTPGSLFFALKGNKTHGHNFLDEAFKNGASLAIIEDPELLKSSANAEKLLVVPDSLIAFSQLAAKIRADFKGHVVAVAGSVGKTTTKDLLGELSSKLLKCSWSKKSFNNLLGVSFTICNADLAADLWILELGMNHVNELAQLSKLSLPNLALITQIAPEHMEFFKNLDQVADAEFEVLAGLDKKGFLITNAEDTLAAQARDRNLKLWQKEGIKELTFGKNQAASLVVKNFKHIIDHKLSAQFDLFFEGKTYQVKTNYLGSHNANNFSAAILALRTILPNLDMERLISYCNQLTPTPMRLNQLILKDGTLIVDDSYNSSPEAVRAALSIFAEIKATGRKIGIVLGDMFELGDEAIKYHQELVPELVKLAPDLVITMGNLAKYISSGLSNSSVEAIHAESFEEICDQITRLSGAAVLVKASRGMGLDKVVKKLQSN